MTDELTISQLTPVVSLLPAALIEIVQTSASFSATIQQVIDLVGGAGITSINADVTAAQIIAGTAGRISLVDAGATHTFDIDSAYVGQATITTLGIITTGVWSATAITYTNLSFSEDIVNADISLTAAIAFSKMATLTINRALISNGSGFIIISAVTATELGFVSGVTSAIQTQIDAKGTGDALVANPLSQFAATTSLQLLGVISDETGTGLLVFGTSPTIITPTITSFVNATHDHSNAAGGGNLTNSALTSGVFAAITGIGVQSQALNMSTNFIDIDDIAVPANPAVGVRRIFTDTATGKLSVRTNGGTTVSLEESGSGGEANTISSQGGGTFALTASTPKIGVDLRVISVSNGDGMNASLSTDILTLAVASTVVQTDQANVFGDFLQTFKDNQFKINSPDDADGVTFVNSNQTADRNLTIPVLTGNRNIVVTTEASQIVIGTEVTGASTSLTDTADIAYLNTANVYIAGTRQDFLGLLAGTSGLNVGGIAGNPTSQVDGDIWLNTSSNTLFGRINGANVDLGAVGGGDMVLADVQTVTGAKQFGTIGGAVGKLIVAGSTSGTTILNAAAVAGSTTMTFPATSGTVVVIGLASQIVIGTEVTGASTALTDTADIAYLNQANTFGAFLNSFISSTMRIPLSATPTMAVDGDFAIDTTITDFSMGLIKYFDGEEMAVVALPIAELTTPVDGNVVAYNATNDEFELAAPAGGGLWTVLGDYEASSAEASHNFSFTAVDFDDDSKLVLVIDLVTTAQLALLLRINEVTGTSYFVDGRRIGGGSETIIDLNSQTSIQLLSSTVLDIADRPAFCVVEIGLSKGATADRPMLISTGGSIASIQEQIFALETTDSASIIDIDVLTSTSTWKIGTRMTLYKVARA